MSEGTVSESTVTDSSAERGGPAGHSAASTVVLWDLDGTLCDLLIDIADVRAWKAKLEQRFGTERAGAGGVWTGGWSPMLPSLEAALSAVGADAAERAQTYDDLDRWELAALNGVRLHPDAITVASRLETLGVRQAIITNNGPLAAERGLAEVAAGCGDQPVPRWIRVATRCAAYRAKPMADMLLHALEPATAPSLVLVVGDQPGDVAAADDLRERTAFDVVSVQASAGVLSATPSDVARLQAAGLGWVVGV